MGSAEELFRLLVEFPDGSPTAPRRVRRQCFLPRWRCRPSKLPGQEYRQSKSLSLRLILLSRNDLIGTGLYIKRRGKARLFSHHSWMKGSRECGIAYSWERGKNKRVESSVYMYIYVGGIDPKEKKILWAQFSSSFFFRSKKTAAERVMQIAISLPVNLSFSSSTILVVRPAPRAELENRMNCLSRNTHFRFDIIICIYQDLWCAI